jgi:hypothetical protein
MWKAALASLYAGALLLALGQTVVGAVLLAFGLAYVAIRAN